MQNTFPRHPNLLRCTCIHIYIYIYRPLSKAPNPQLLPGLRSVGCPLLQVCVHLDGLNAENTFHCWLYSVIVYVTNKAHLSLILIILYYIIACNCMRLIAQPYYVCNSTYSKSSEILQYYSGNNCSNFSL